MADLEIKNLHVSVGGKEILKGVTMHVNLGDVVAVMGPNGSGKSTLAFAVMGHPAYRITGTIKLFGKDITKLPPHKRARLGLFLSFQYPQAVPGVSVSGFLRTALNTGRSQPVPIPEFLTLLKEKMKMLSIEPSFAARFLNDGFSGGEKKKMEMLQLAVLNPKIAILDETDSGTDVDALKTITRGIARFAGKEKGIMVITHYKRMLEYMKPDRVIVMVDGSVAAEGGKELVDEIDKNGYAKYTAKH